MANITIYPYGDLGEVASGIQATGVILTETSTKITMTVYEGAALNETLTKIIIQQV